MAMDRPGLHDPNPQVDEWVDQDEASASECDPPGEWVRAWEGSSSDDAGEVMSSATETTFHGEPFLRALTLSRLAMPMPMLLQVAQLSTNGLQNLFTAVTGMLLVQKARCFHGSKEHPDMELESLRRLLGSDGDDHGKCGNQASEKARP
ncbi:CUL1 [Symbiodinium pilosum]|uniref:CUL1 protein n=1 Tax=Symbiodinium pilosum TaxID=2952 RepID=A0A812VNE5_SYMPI|nr:CUL1 [Symbiodinium pilosum]